MVKCVCIYIDYVCKIVLNLWFLFYDSVLMVFLNSCNGKLVLC